MKFLYKDVINKGFVRQDQNDSVFFDQNGYNWFLVTLQLRKNIYLDWECTTHEVELIRIDKDATIKGRIQIKSEEHLVELIDFFTDK